jgi:hypothetical protein
VTRDETLALTERVVHSVEAMVKEAGGDFQALVSLYIAIAVGYAEASGMSVEALQKTIAIVYGATAAARAQDALGRHPS